MPGSRERGGFVDSEQGLLLIMLLTSIFAKVLIGLVVGVLVGLTGLGGGVLLLPLLIFGMGVPPMIAVGSDAAFNFLTKIGAGLLHWRRGNVSGRVVAALSAGSIPGSVAGVACFAHLQVVYGSGINNILRTFIGILLVAVTLLLMSQGWLEKHFALIKRPVGRRYWELGLIGLVSGFLVGMSSTGSGSIIMVLLLILVREAPVVLVASNIVHAVALTGFTSLLHFRLGTVDPTLVIPLMIGSLPGGILGVRLGTALPGHWLRRGLCVVLLASGARMLAV